MGKEIRKLVILDHILLTSSQRENLRLLAEEIVEFPGLSAKDILAQLQHEMDSSPAPMCWTQLAQEKVASNELLKRLNGADFVITCWTGIPDEILVECKGLRYIGFWTNLAQHRINLSLAKELGIHVTYLPDYGTQAVAEMTLAGMLAVSRGLLRQSHDTIKGKWPYELLKTGRDVPQVEELPYRLLFGKKLGIVGFGRIGQCVARLAQAFGMTILYYSKHRSPEWEAVGAEFLSLESLFKESDIVTVHLSPYAPKGMISRELIQSMKDEAIFINTSSGNLVDQQALLAELESGRIRAFIDVYEGLPPRKEFQKINLKENVLTYRSGWFAREAIITKGDMLIQNIKAFLQGKPTTIPATNNIIYEPEYEKPCAQLESVEDAERLSDDVRNGKSKD